MVYLEGITSVDNQWFKSAGLNRVWQYQNGQNRLSETKRQTPRGITRVVLSTLVQTEWLITLRFTSVDNQWLKPPVPQLEPRGRNRVEPRVVPVVQTTAGNLRRSV